MTMLNFNANEVEPTVAFDPIPAGKYLAAVTASEMRPTKNGAGTYLQLTLTILEGEHKGRLLWARLCLDHPNKQTASIAQAQLSALCRAINVLTPRDSAELHNIPLTIRVKCKKREDTGEVVNEISGYLARENANTAKPVQNASSTPPWRR